MNTIGVVFPGQGSQTVGMLSDMAAAFPEVIETYNEASAIVGYDLWKLVLEGPSERLDQTQYTQPALLTGSVAIWRTIQARRPLAPAWMAGHSLGEYTALVCANAISFGDAVRLVAARGQFMQEAVPMGQGALAAIIGLSDAAVTDLCEQSRQAEEVLAAANFNSPGQVVIAGHKVAVLRALPLAKTAGAKLAKLLPVSVPSHCILMKPAAAKLQAFLAELALKAPSVPVVNNVDVAIYQSAEDIRQGLVRQLCLPVRWVETVQFFAKKGITTMIECGPGKVLTSLNKRIVSDLECINTADLENLQAVLNH